MKDREPLTSCEVNRGEAYYTIIWSPLTEVDKFIILNKVPSMPGIFELYYMDEYRKLVCFYIARVWYGGLRGTIRDITDPLIVIDEKRKWVLENKKCYFRYSIVNSFADMEDLLHIFASKRLNPKLVPDHSGRYEELYIKETSDDKIIES